jgi:hypothetical protein
MAHAFACLNALGAPLARPGRPVAQRRRLAATGVSQSHGVYLSPRPARSCMRCRASQEEQEKADKVHTATAGDVVLSCVCKQRALQHRGCC